MTTPRQTPYLQNDHLPDRPVQQAEEQRELRRLINKLKPTSQESRDGSGFPFRGRYDLATLTAKQLGPVSLKERVASLRGELLLTSTLSGSKLEMTLPLDQLPLAGAATHRRRARRTAIHGWRT